MRRASSASFLIIMWKISFYKFKTLEMCDFFCCVCVRLSVCVCFSVCVCECVYTWLCKCICCYDTRECCCRDSCQRGGTSIQSARNCCFTHAACFPLPLHLQLLQLFCSSSSAPYPSLAIDISGASFRCNFLHAALQSICQLIAAAQTVASSSSCASTLEALNVLPICVNMYVYI